MCCNRKVMCFLLFVSGQVALDGPTSFIQRPTVLRRPTHTDLHVFSNMIDPDIAPLAFYALVYSIYFYLHLPRNSLEYVVVVADVRKGEGWANTSPLKIMPFMKQAASHMELFPRCLSKCHVYPVPSFAKVIWLTIRSFLKEIVVKKVDLHWGSSSITSAIPQSLEEYFDQNTIKDFERHRRSEFVE